MFLCTEFKNDKVMNVPLITWSCIVAIIVLAFAVKMYVAVCRHSLKGHKIFTIGREWEEIYVPGDRMIKNDYDYDEFDM